MFKSQKIFIAGNVLEKPRLQVHDGKIFSRFWIVINRFTYSEGQWERTSLRHAVLVQGQKAEICEKYLENGFPVAIEGVLDSETVIIAEDVHLLGLRTARKTGREES